MNPEQIALVKSSFAEAATRPDDLARVFYDRLFEVAPQLRSLVPDDRRDRERLLTDELVEIVDRLDRFDELVAQAGRIGARHAARGARAEHYDLFGPALLDAVAASLGDRFTPAVEAAWRLAYNLVAETMQQGAAEQSVRRTAPTDA